MISKHSRWRMFVAVMLSAVLLFVPVATGFAMANIVGATNPLAYEEVNGVELEELAQKAISDSGVQQLVGHLTDKGADLVGKRAAKWQFDGHDGRAVLLNYKGNEDVQIVYSESDGNVKVGAGVIKTTDKKIKIKAYDLVDGKIYHSSTITSIKGPNGKFAKPSVEWNSSPLVKNPKAIDSLPDFSAAASSCTICKTVCSYVYAGGCGVTGYFLCVAACTPFAWAVCWPICAVVFALICNFGQNNTCPVVCASYC